MAGPPPKTDLQPKDISRRGILQKSIAGAVACGLAACASTPKTPGHVAKADAEYQDSPKGLSRCGLCKHFASPSTCEIVAGPVRASGWCKFYALL